MNNRLFVLAPIRITILILPTAILMAEPTSIESKSSDQEVFQEILEETARIRGLDFKETVPMTRISRADIPALFREEISRVYSDEDFERIETALSLLGAIPAGLEIDKMLLAMVGEQVAGLYDPIGKEMMVVGNLSLEVGLVQIILEHELTHALTDQHFDLRSLPIEDIHNDDRALAALCLVEGDATLSMLEYGKRLGIQGMVSTLLISLFMDQGSFYSAPTFYQGSLIFPYLGGEMFLLELMSNYRIENDRLVSKRRFTGFDWQLVDYLYTHPPVSTEQILHPEKLANGDDPPIDVDPKFLEPITSSGWENIWENTLGEFLIRTLMEENLRITEAHRAAEGWGGDRYFLLRKGEKHLLVWVSHWDSHDEREEFANSCVKIMKQGGFPANTIVLRSGDEPSVLVGISRDLNEEQIDALLVKQ